MNHAQNLLATALKPAFGTTTGQTTCPNYTGAILPASRGHLSPTLFLLCRSEHGSKGMPYKRAEAMPIKRSKHPLLAASEPAGYLLLSPPRSCPRSTAAQPIAPRLQGLI
mmetsp:Transcript_26867/g.68382  ORF Transcript_26867/g.68382 Transcript_26867/m.68382 type:complete len:110 (-) Transcript_26867:726-1055(-)